MGCYLLDANVFIQAKNTYYAFDVCPGFWQWLDDAHNKGVVLSVKQVRDELLAREDALSKWCKNRKPFFVPTDDGKTYESLGLLSTWVMDKYEPPAQASFLGAADFVLVGYAHAHSLTLVTHEVFSFGIEVKIPNACKAMDVGCMTTHDMLAAEGVKFVLSSN